jgi:hypothetical protein
MMERWQAPSPITFSPIVAATRNPARLSLSARSSASKSILAPMGAPPLWKPLTWAPTVWKPGVERGEEVAVEGVLHVAD